MIKQALCLSAALFALYGGFVRAETPSRPYLTLEGATAGLQACQDLAAEAGWRIAVAVLDRGGRPVAFERADDVFQKQIEIAFLKAETAATTPVGSKALGDAARKRNSPLAGIENVPGLIAIEGGESIRLSSGYVVGGVGVSGARPDEDGRCARAAAAAIAEALQ